MTAASAHLCDGFASLVGQPPESLGATCRVEPAPINPSLFFQRHPDQREQLRAGLEFSGPTVLGAGRLVPIKGFDLLIAAMAAIPAALRPDLVLVGDGPERANLARQARGSNLRVRFLGTLGQHAVADAMAAADLLVHPCRTLPDGRTEGMPLVVREARACGLPVVASASGGLCELRGLDGYHLVEPGDVAALAGAIRKLLG